MDDLLVHRLGAQDEQPQDRVVGDGAARSCTRRCRSSASLATRTTRSFSVGRHYRDALSAALMISNDRIFAKSASMLLVLQGRLTECHDEYDQRELLRGLVEHGLIVPGRRAGRLRPRRRVRGRARALQRPRHRSLRGRRRRGLHVPAGHRPHDHREDATTWTRSRTSCGAVFSFFGKDKRRARLCRRRCTPASPGATRRA